MDEEKQELVLLDRGMNKDECRAMCTSPQIPLREKLFFRMIYETTTRPREVLESRIELWNRNTGEITFSQILANARIYLEHRIWYPVHPQDQRQIQPLDQASHPGRAQDHETDRQHQRNATALCGEQEEGTYFHQREDGEKADPAAF
jgi:hypothetical protein